MVLTERPSIAPLFGPMLEAQFGPQLDAILPQVPAFAAVDKKNGVAVDLGCGNGMLAVALACLPVFMTGREIARWEGGVFLGYYIAYVAYLVLAAQQHDVLPAFSSVMMGFVVPLTVVTLVVVVVRRPAADGGPT